MRNLITIEKFHELAQSGSDPGEITLRRQYTADVEVADDDSREVLFSISDAVVDRAGDSLSVQGWELSNFQKNPVVLWAHDSGKLPVAQAAKTYVEGARLKSLAIFTPADLYDFGYTVYRFYKAKFLNAVSVGFNPLKWAWVDSNERRGIDFIQQELLEYSAVPVPCHPGALAERGADLSVDPLIAWATEVIRQHKRPELKTVRDIEHFLRDVGGFSRSEAKGFASPAWEAIQRDADGQTAITTEPDMHSVAALLQTRTNTLRRLTWN